MRVVLLGAMLGMALAGPAVADQASDSATTCGDSAAAPDQRIAACSWLIPSGLLDQKGLATIYLNRGHAFGAKGDLLRATKDYSQALVLKPDFVQALRDRGLTYAAMPFPDRAIPDLDKIIALDPTDAAAFSGRGYSQYVLGKSDLAIADLDQAIRLGPDDAEAYYRRAQAHIGNHAFSNQVEYDRTIQDFSQAIRLKPDYAEAYFGRCQMLLLHDKALAAARSDCILAAAYAPRDTTIRWGLGQIDFQLGHFADAAADGDAVLKIDPKDAASLFLRGAARRRGGDTTAGDADIAAAKALSAHIAEEQQEFGITP